MLIQDNKLSGSLQPSYIPPPKDPKLPRGESSHLSKLTWAQVREIRRLYAMGVTQARLAEDFGVTRQTIRQIVRNYTWVER